MKKQLFGLLLTFLLVTGCNSNTEEIKHTHTYSSDWSYNDDYHWHASTCGHDTKKDYSHHTFTNWTTSVEPTATSDGLKYRDCEVCSYHQEESIPASGEEHTHTFSSTWSYDDNEHWHASTCGHNVRSSVATHTFDSWIIDKDPTTTEEGSKHRNCTVCPYQQIETIPSEEEEETISEIDSIQDMNILHAWNWKLNDIKTRLKRIKKAGYGAIQISPMQPHVDNADGATGVTQDNWWKLYQPLAFKVATGKENILGTKDDLTSLCNSAQQEGLKIIVDIVSNHLAGTNNNYSSQVYKQYPLHDFGKFNDYSVQAVVQGHIGLPDLDTSNQELQDDVLSMMKEYIDCGVSGFRFDAAKHIETPDDGDYASDYWPYVLSGTTSYALDKGKDAPYYYGEILGTCGNGRSFSSYTKYMSVIDSKQSGNVLTAVVNRDDVYISTTYDTKEDPSKLVIWAESHDNYANFDDTTRDLSIDKVNKAYAIQASRKDTATLYYARPSNMYVSMCSIDDNSGWQSTVTKAINKFHDRYIDKSENLYTEDNTVINVRGSSKFAGAALVNIKGNTSKSLTLEGLNGDYVDLVSKNEYKVTNETTTISFTDGVCILIPKDAYVPEEEDPTYVSSLVIEDAPTTYSYLAWVWGNGSSSFRAFSPDNNAIGLSLSNGESFTIVEFPLGTTIATANWSNAIRQTVDMNYSGSQQIIPFSSLNWK